MPKKNPIRFQNGSNYDYLLITKELAEKFKKQLTCLGENICEHISFTVPIEKEVTRIDKMEKTLQKICLTYYSLLIAQNLWQARYQVL